VHAESPPSAFDSSEVVSAQPGDVILFRCPQVLRSAQRERVVAMLEEVFPHHESVILDGGQDIAVLRPVPGFFARFLRRLRGTG
jgi:hypothetical protein